MNKRKAKKYEKKTRHVLYESASDTLSPLTHFHLLMHGFTVTKFLIRFVFIFPKKTKVRKK